MTESPKHLLDTTSEAPQRPSKIAKTTTDSEDEEEQQQQQQSEKPTNPNPRMQRYLVAIEYIGTRFSGSQQQLNCRTVVGALQKNEGDVTVIDVRCVPADFHARFKAKERTYFYRLLSGPESLSTFERDRAWHVPEELDLLAMQEACKILVGHHDFSSFRAAGCQAKSPMRTLDELDVSEVVSNPYFPSIIERRQNNQTQEDLHASSNTSETDLPLSSISIDDKARGFNSGTELGFGIRRRHRYFVVTTRSRSFLYHQVRLLVGVLKAVGTRELTIADVERILNAKTVTAASPMAPACGLYLGHVKYDLP